MQQQQTPFNNFEQQQSIFNQLSNSLNNNNNNHIAKISERERQQRLEKQRSYFIQANPRHQNQYDNFNNFKGHGEKKEETTDSMEENNEEDTKMSTNEETKQGRTTSNTPGVHSNGITSSLDGTMNKKQEYNNSSVLKKTVAQWPFGHTECCSSVFQLCDGIVQSISPEKYQSLLKLLFISKLSYNISVDDNMQRLWSQANHDFYRTYSPYVQFVDPKKTLKDSPDNLDCLVSFMTQFIFRDNPMFRNSLLQNASKVIDLNKQQMSMEQQTTQNIKNQQQTNNNFIPPSSLFAVPTKAPTKKKVMFKKNK